jgi:hypothetical protein
LLQASRLALVEAGVECKNIFVGDWPATKAAGLADGSLAFGQVPMLRE